MRMMKQLLSGLLAFGMILAMCPVITFATDPAAKVTDTDTTATQTEAIEVQKIDENGAPNGIPEDATVIQYLSDFHNTSNPLATNDRVYAQVNNAICLDSHYSNRLYVFAGSHTQWGVVNDPNNTEGTTLVETINGVSVDSTKIYLGARGTLYEKGLGVHPTAGNAATQRYITYNVVGLGDRFYAVVGGTDKNITNPNNYNHSIDFELYGSTDGTTFVKLAYATGIRAYLTAEFDVDISGYNYIKLMARMSSGLNDNQMCSVAWGNACIYSTGKFNYGAVDAGNGNTQNTWTGMSSSDVAAYEEMLVNDGWTMYDQKEITNPETGDENYFATYVKGSQMTHLNYFPGLDNGRFQAITGPKSTLIPQSEVGTGERIVTPSVSILACGDALSMVVQMADGSFVVIDGGRGGVTPFTIYQDNPVDGTQETITIDYLEDIENLLAFMEAKKPASHAKPKVYWMATHAHADHIVLPYLIFWGKTNDGGPYNNRFDLEGIIYNFPNYEETGFELSAYASQTALNTEIQQMTLYSSRFVEKAKVFNPNVKEYVYHTGQTMKLAGGEIEFLFTHEDNWPYGSPTGNHTSGVWRFNFDNGMSLMITGDAQQLQQIKPSLIDYENNNHLANVYGSYLKSDMLQMIHHGFNGGSQEFYEAVDPTVCFWPQWEANFYEGKRVLGNYTDPNSGLNYSFNNWVRTTNTAEGVSRIHYAHPLTGAYTVYLPTVTYHDNGQVRTEGVLYSADTPNLGTRPNGNHTVLSNFGGMTGFEFQGWATSVNGSIAYSAGDTITLTNGNVDLYAVYEQDIIQIPLNNSGVFAGPTGTATNITYLSSLHNPTNSLLTTDRMVGQLNSKIFLNATYNGQTYVFTSPTKRWDLTTNSLLVDGARELLGVTYYKSTIYLGAAGTKFENGLGVHPAAGNAASRYIVYDVSGLGNRFYAVAGGTGYNITNPNAQTHYVDFELYGSVDGENFYKLAYATGVRSYLTAEFDVDITGYNYIKLLVKMSDGYTDNQSCAVAWGGAFVYDSAECVDE